MTLGLLARTGTIKVSGGEGEAFYLFACFVFVLVVPLIYFFISRKIKGIPAWEEKEAEESEERRRIGLADGCRRVR